MTTPPLARINGKEAQIVYADGHYLLPIEEIVHIANRGIGEIVQKWIGQVTSVSDDSFTAELYPLKGEGGEIVADIYKYIVDDDDLPLLQSGAMFYWAIGKRGQFLRFKRVPPVTKGQLMRAKLKAREIERVLFGGDDPRERCEVANIANPTL